MENKTLVGLRNICRDFVVFSAAAAALFFIFPYLFKLLLPFLLAGFLCFIAKPLYAFLLRLHIPRLLASFLSLCIVFFVFGSLIWLTATQIIRELFSFSESFSVIYKSSVKTISDIAKRLGGFRFADGKMLSSELNTLISGFEESFRRLLSETISSVTSLLIEYAKNIPNIIFILFTSFFSAFFMLKDREAILVFFRRLIGNRATAIFFKAKHAVCGAVSCYIRAQLIIGCIMFCVLLIGFLVLKVDYALLFALITAIVDAVPVFGTGTMLIPWAVFKIFSDNPTLGWGLLTLYGVCVLTRQLCEPKIIGTHLGIHPLATLFSIYVGLCLFGFFGLIIGPIIALMVKNLLKEC